MLTCFGHLDELIVAELVQVLLHLGHGLGDGAEGEVRVDADGGQLLGLGLGDQHVVALQRHRRLPAAPSLILNGDTQEGGVSHLDEVDVVLGAGQLRDVVVPPLQVRDLVAQALQVALGVVEGGSLVGADQLGHLLLHPLDGADHVAEGLLALLQRPLGRVLRREHGHIPSAGPSRRFYQTLSSHLLGGMWVIHDYTNLQSIDRLLQLLHLLQSVVDLLLDLGLRGAEPLL